MKPRILVLPLAALIIGGLCFWRLYWNPRTVPAQLSPRVVQQQAPLFHGENETGPPVLDEQNRPVRLKTYLGRHPIVLVFFNRATGAANDETLRFLQSQADRLADLDLIVLALSDALPQENRKSIEASAAFPFPLLSDPTFHVQRRWGTLETSGLSDGSTLRETRSATFLINRSGQVNWDASRGTPLSETDPVASLRRLLDESAPGSDT